VDKNLTIPHKKNKGWCEDMVWETEKGRHNQPGIRAQEERRDQTIWYRRKLKFWDTETEEQQEWKGNWEKKGERGINGK